jgi:hypothetical protein
MPRDLFADLDSWDEEDERDAGADDTKPVEAMADDFLGSGMTLEAVASGNGRMADIAQELLTIRAEREAKAEQERLAMEGEVVLDAGNANLDDPELRPVLLALVEDRRAAVDQTFDRNYRQVLRARGTPSDEIDSTMAGLKAQQAEIADWLGAPSLHELPEYRQHQRQKVETARAQKVATEVLLRESPGWRAEVEAADEGIHATLAKALSK